MKTSALFFVCVLFLALLAGSNGDDDSMERRFSPRRAPKRRDGYQQQFDVYNNLENARYFARRSNRNNFEQPLGKFVINTILTFYVSKKQNFVIK